MPTPTVAGSRCVRRRHRNAECRACTEVCPRNAIALAPAPVIDSGACNGCYLCASVCPPTAIGRFGGELASALPVLNRSQQPVLGCRQFLDGRNSGRVGCLGGLSAVDLLALAVIPPRRISLNTDHCVKCAAGGDVLAALRSRLSMLTQAGLLTAIRRVDIGLPPRTGNGGAQDRSRRGFLRLLPLRWSEAKARLADDKTGRQLRTPADRLEAVCALLPPGAGELARDCLGYTITRTATCNDCCRCVGICTTRAVYRIRKGGQKRLVIDTRLCDGCGGCLAVCSVGGVELRSGKFNQEPAADEPSRV